MSQTVTRESMGSWIPYIEGPGATLLGFTLSSLSRSYRERRAHLLAEQTKITAERKKDEDMFRNQILNQLSSIQTQLNINTNNISKFEGILETLTKGVRPNDQ